MDCLLSDKLLTESKLFFKETMCMKIVRRNTHQWTNGLWKNQAVYREKSLLL